MADTLDLLQQSAKVYARAVGAKSDVQLMRIARALLQVATSYQQVELDELPVELLGEIQSHFDPRSRARFGTTSRRMHSIVAADSAEDRERWRRRKLIMYRSPEFWRVAQEEYGHPHDYPEDLEHFRDEPTREPEYHPMAERTYTFPGGDTMAVSGGYEGATDLLMIWADDDHKVTARVDLARSKEPYDVQVEKRLKNERGEYVDRLYSHRERGPAKITYYGDNGNIRSALFFKNGRNHRSDGPAVLVYNKDGTLRTVGWFLNGRKYDDRGDWERAVQAEYVALGKRSREEDDSGTGETSAKRR